jgi:enoyl-CoA hydratase/3-hydroxyacyl-CoA dehydrogenase
METPMILNNPLLRKPSRPLPKNVVVVGAGTIGPDIGYYLKSAIPDRSIALSGAFPTTRARRSSAAR